MCGAKFENIRMLTLINVRMTTFSIILKCRFVEKPQIINNLFQTAGVKTLSRKDTQKNLILGNILVASPSMLTIYLITSSVGFAFPVFSVINSPSSYIYYGVIKIRLKNLSGICLHDTDNQLHASVLSHA